MWPQSHDIVIVGCGQVLTGILGGRLWECHADVYRLVFAGEAQVHPTGDGHEGDAPLHRRGQEVIPQRGKQKSSLIPRPTLNGKWPGNKTIQTTFHADCVYL